MATKKKKAPAKCRHCKNDIGFPEYKPVRVPQGGRIREFKYVGTDLGGVVKEDEWPVKPTRKTIKHDDKSVTVEVTYHPPIKIADMHDMHLVNTIKSVIRTATRVLMAPFSTFGRTKAQILAGHPQWPALLAEVKKRKLRIAFAEGYKGAYVSHEWFDEAMKEIVFRNLEE
jgi:hypothetical protein